MSLLIEEQRQILKILYPTRHTEYQELLEPLASIVEKEIYPSAAEIDRTGTFPEKQIRELFRMGFTAIPFPREYGGLGLPTPVYTAAMEIVAKGCASTALSTSIHGTVCEGLLHFGSE